MAKSKIGLIGLATMGANLARNLANKKIHTVVFNRTTEKTLEFIKEFGNEYLAGEKTLKNFIAKLEQPRKIFILVKAGEAVDMVINELIPLLDKEDILIDLGNSHYKDTMRRQSHLFPKKIHFLGCGISGGEQGALHGPSLMPGGDKKAYAKVSKFLEKISAQDSSKGKCVTYLGPEGSGHFVKMVHNGIEYAIMQLIAESYDILKNIGKFNNEELAKIFTDYNKSTNSYLLEITAKIFQKKEGGKYIIDFIKDIAGQKGTGKWTTEEAHNFGVALTSVNSAVDARILSGDIPSRTISPKIVKFRKNKTKLPDKKTLIEIVEDSLEMCSLITYLQGFNLIRAASSEYQWNLDTSEIARIWQGGCIIRSNLLKNLQKAFSETKEAKAERSKVVEPLSSKAQNHLRTLINLATSEGIPVLTFSSTLAHFDTFLRPRLPQNLVQAQRDFFGAHGYERTDKKGVFHTEWS